MQRWDGMMEIKRQMLKIFEEVISFRDLEQNWQILGKIKVFLI